MSETYFFKKGAIQLGPYSLERMRTLVRQGQIGRGHLVSIDGGATWTSAGTHHAIFAASGKDDGTNEEPDDTYDPDDAGPAPPPDGTWWYSTAGQEPRLLSEAEIHGLIRSGRATAADMVCAEGQQQWIAIAGAPAFAFAFNPKIEIESDPKTPRRPRRGKRRPKKDPDPRRDQPGRVNTYGLSGFICALVAVVLLAIPCVVWLMSWQSSFWIFNLVLPLFVLALLGLGFSVLGLSRGTRALATAGTILGVIAVTLAVMAMFGSATLRWRLAMLRRVQIDSCVTDIELARKKLGESIAAYRNARKRPDEDQEIFGLRQKAQLAVLAGDLATLVVAYDGHVTVTAGTSEFGQAFDGLTQLRKTMEDVQQTVRSAGGGELLNVLESGHSNVDRIRLLMDTLALYEKGTITRVQAEAKMTGR